MAEVVVTADRREQSLQTVAASLTVLGGAQLAERGIQNTLDLARAVPNLTVEPVVGIAAPRIFLRGVGTVDFNANASNPVTTNVDDVYVGFLNATAVQLFDVQRVEVLRGPQGTLYGRNTTAGAINYVSNGPSDTFGGEGLVRYGRFNERLVEGAVTGPILGDTLTGRIAFNYEGRDGLGRNLVTGAEDLGSRENWALRGLLRWRPNSRLDVLLNVHGGHAEAYQVPWTVQGIYDPATGGLCSPTDVEALRCVNALGYRRTSGGRYDAAYDYAGQANQGLGERLDTFGTSLKATYDLGFAKLTSISAYDHDVYRRIEDTDATPLAILGVDNYDRFNSYSQELRLSSPGDQRLNWIGGAYYYHDTVRKLDNSDLLRQLRPLLGFSPANFVFLAQQSYRQGTDAAAVFGRVDFGLTDTLRIAGGLRYTYEDRRFAEAIALAEPTFSVPVVDARRGLVNDNVSGEIKLEYTPKTNLLLYGSIARGFKSGGFSGGLVFSNDAVTTFEPETLTSYEVGVKSQWLERRLRFNASAFYYDYKNLQLFTFVNQGGVPTTVEDNAGAAELYGLEAEILFSPVRRLDLSINLGLVHTELTRYQTSFGADYSGNELAGAPSATLDLAIDKRFDLSGWELRLHADSDYRSRSFYTEANSPYLEKPSYWVTGARVQLSPPGRRYSVAVYGQSIFNTKYNNAKQDLTTFGEYFAVPADPATWGVELSGKF